MAGRVSSREGIYASHVTTGRARRAAGIQAGPCHTHGQKPQPAAARELAQLREENALGGGVCPDPRGD